MIPSTLAHLENELRQASAQQQYGAIERLALRFGDAARSEIGKLKSGDPLAAEIAQHVLNVLEWSRMVTLVGRATTAGELRGIPFLKLYLAKPPARPPVVRIDG